jgi:class 3 adenylate cyclase/tetratricopeptide (TPR) repeat protein
MVACPACGSDNEAGARFCDECGAALASTCPQCGALVREGKRFCAQCGTPLRPQQAEPPQTVGAAPVASSPVMAEDATAEDPPTTSGDSELRRVSVLFVDLVGYTSLTETWDAEDVRELLSGYFDAARTVVSRYGGTIEKYIGDAVMAVWGAPTAQQDDAERAVRAALEIIEAVADYGERRGVQGLSARAGIVTGQVAAWASPGEGLVTGDRVNTAARVQTTAEPGSVYVDESTWSATQAAVAYVSTGEHRVKGKAESLRLWRAVRVVANRGGAQRVDGLEAGFVGRSRELSLVKELFHACVEGGRARLVLVAGAAGVGKSRLGWEFEKYIDGLAGTVMWHRGRCLSYGDGVAFWALAEMVRQRFDIAEDEPADAAQAKLLAALPAWVPEPSEREFVATRLGVLIGTMDAELSRQELFAGWRLFVERLTTGGPVVLLFEDLHWADSGLLDFLEYVLDWSAGLPIFVLAFTRPELAERRPGWLADRRNATTVHLDPLGPAPMDQLLDDLVPGMPADSKGRIAERAAGVPLYAVEMIRALVDKDLVIPREGTYVLTGDLGELDVPGTLASLLAARLDGLPPLEKQLVKGLAVLGETFPGSAAAAVCDAPPATVEDLLRDLVRKEVLTVRDDPLSPERGQYAFVQSMLRTVAYEMLTKRERKLRHLAVAEHLRRTFPDDGDEVAEVIATHYHDAYTAAPSDADALAIREQAAETFERAGQRAGTLGAPDAAEKAYSLAASLAVTEPDATRLTENAGRMAWRASRFGDALTFFESAASAHTAAGRPRDAARLAESIGTSLAGIGQLEEGSRRMRDALTLLQQDPLDPAVAEIHAALAKALQFMGRHEEEVAAHLEEALTLATALELPRVLADALTTKAFLLADANRMAEALALMRAAIDVAAEHGLTKDEARAHANLGDLQAQSDSPAAARELEASLGYGVRVGDGYTQAISLVNLSLINFQNGSWDDAERFALQAIEAARNEHLQAGVRMPVILLMGATGRQVEAEAQLRRMAVVQDSDDMQSRVALAIARAAVAAAAKQPELALENAQQAVDLVVAEQGLRSEGFRWGWPQAIEAALTLERFDKVGELLALVADAPRGHVPPYLRAQLAHYRGLRDAALGRHDTVEADLNTAVRLLEGLGYPYWLARAQADLAHWLISQDRRDDAEPLLAAAGETFTRLGAQPELDKLRLVTATEVG